jgi:hypothetical protein
LVLLLSILLVLATAGGVAAVGHALGLSWPVDRHRDGHRRQIVTHSKAS